MIFSFKAKIYKVGINPCVKVPFKISMNMTATKGYIPVKGTINDFPFVQTLCPVKNEPYRLYVNGLMLKGSGRKNGDTATFTIEQDFAPRNVEALPMPKRFSRKLREEQLSVIFLTLTPGRRKEILRYLNYLKTIAALERNIDKVISMLRKNP